jgi:hypothetical protein
MPRTRSLFPIALAPESVAKSLGCQRGVESSEALKDRRKSRRAGGRRSRRGDGAAMVTGILPWGQECRDPSRPVGACARQSPRAQPPPLPRSSHRKTGSFAAPSFLLKTETRLGMEVTMLRGSCLCGGIRYEINGKLYDALNCHCSMCRKAQGAAFRSRAKVHSAEFRLLCGEELLTFFASSPGNHRGFCRVCGSPILSKFDDDPSVFSLPLGGLDDDPGIRPQMHVFIASKAPWFAITDDLAQFAELPSPTISARSGSAPFPDLKS